MSGAYPYIISYFIAGLLLAGASLAHGHFSRGKLAIAFVSTVLLWPLIVLVAPEIFFKSPNEEGRLFESSKLECGSLLIEQLTRLAQSELFLLAEDERKHLAKAARFGETHISLFGNRSNFEEILNAFWSLSVPPEVYHDLKRATYHLKENYDPATQPLFSRRAPDWYIGFSTEFVKSIAKVDRKKQGRILEAIGKIAAAPMENYGDTIKPLTGDMAGLWRCRLGDDRLIYFPHSSSKKVVLISFASRGEAYDQAVDVPSLTPR
jgi:mRNA-degrading endonuclease RelE of RelBE toxin-antitoxin system